MSTMLIGILSASAVAAMPAGACLVLFLFGAGRLAKPRGEPTAFARTAAMLAYLLGPVSGLATLLLQRNDRFVRFHAAQAVVAGLLAIGVSSLLLFPLILLALLPPIGWIVAAGIGTAFGLALAAHWRRLLVHAYRGREWEDLLVGDVARRLATWRMPLAGPQPGTAAAAS